MPRVNLISIAERRGLAVLIGRFHAFYIVLWLTVGPRLKSLMFSTQVMLAAHADYRNTPKG